MLERYCEIEKLVLLYNKGIGISTMDSDKFIVYHFGLSTHSLHCLRITLVLLVNLAICRISRTHN